MTAIIDLPAILREFGSDLRLRDSENMGPTRAEVAMATAIDRLRRELADANAEHERDCEFYRNELTIAQHKLSEARAVCAEQAENEGLWFIATTVTEAYLQAALRRLHAVVEAPRG